MERFNSPARSENRSSNSGYSPRFFTPRGRGDTHRFSNAAHWQTVPHGGWGSKANTDRRNYQPRFQKSNYKRVSAECFEVYHLSLLYH